MEQDMAKSKANKKPTNVSISKEAAASATAKKPALATKQQSTSFASTKKLGTLVQKVGTRQQQPTPMTTPNNKDTNKKEEEVDEFPVNVPC
ncbi:hypothetical protein ACA910_019934 [Epithemia clementina (nom. ined.)]